MRPTLCSPGVRSFLEKELEFTTRSQVLGAGNSFEGRLQAEPCMAMHSGLKTGAGTSSRVHWSFFSMADEGTQGFDFKT
jgi:hypothetical protein